MPARSSLPGARRAPLVVVLAASLAAPAGVAWGSHGPSRPNRDESPRVGYPFRVESIADSGGIRVTLTVTRRASEMPKGVVARLEYLRTGDDRWIAVGRRRMVDGQAVLRWTAAAPLVDYRLRVVAAKGRRVLIRTGVLTSQRPAPPPTPLPTPVASPTPTPTPAPKK